MAKKKVTKKRTSKKAYVARKLTKKELLSFFNKKPRKQKWPKQVVSDLNYKGHVISKWKSK